MVEINNQRKAFLDMLAWSEGTDNGRSKNQKSWLWRHCRRRAIYWLLRSPSQTCHAKPKTQINRRRTLPASSRWWDVYRKQLGLKDFSPKSQDAVALQIKERRFTYDWSWWYPSGNSTVAAISGLYCRALVMVSSSIRLTAWLQNSEAGGTVEIDVWAESPRLSPPGYLHHRLPVRLLTGYRDNAITYKAQRQKCQRTEAMNAAITDMQMRQRDVAALDAKYTKELADASWKWCSAWWCCRWSSSVAHQQIVSQCVKPPRPPAWIMQPRLADTAERDYFTLGREVDHYAKTTGRNPEVY